MGILKTAYNSLNDAVTILGCNLWGYKTTAEGAVTLTVAEFIDGLYVQTGTPGAVAKTTPTAALIVAAIRGCRIGSAFEFVLDNGGDGTVTVTAGAGVTGSGTLTAATTTRRTFRCVVTNVDTPAVRMISSAAH